MKGIALSFVRHLVAVALAWLGTRGLVDLTTEEAATFSQQVADLIVNIGGSLLAIYVVGEKGLKPLFYRKFGELGPGEVPPETHDTAKVREGVS